MTDELVIKFHPDVPEEVIDLILDNYRSDRVHTHSAIGWHKLKVAAEDCDRICEELRNDPAVKSVFCNHPVKVGATATFTPNDLQLTGGLDQWQFRAIGMQRAWAITTGNEDTVIAVADSGFEFTHQDMQKADGSGTRFLLPGLNTFDDPPNTTNLGVWNSAADHGVMVSGIMAATGNNGKGIAGINWKCKVIPFKISPNGYLNGIFEASSPYAVSLSITEAADRGARVYNCSYILDDPDTSTATPTGDFKGLPSGYAGTLVEFYQDAIDYAMSKNCITGFCAGNQAISDTYPWDIPISQYLTNTVFGGATTKSLHRMNISQFGKWVTCVAPVGTWTGAATPPRVVTGYPNVPSLDAGNTYGTHGGTSSAIPQIMGVASLAVGIAPNLTSWQQLATVKLANDKLDARWHDEFYSAFGQVNAWKACEIAKLAVPGAQPRPTVLFATPQHNSSVYLGASVIGDNQTVSFEALVFDDGDPTVPITVSLHIDGSETPHQTIQQKLTDGPFIFAWRPTVAGAHTFQLKATTTAGTGASEAITVTALEASSTNPPFVGIISHRPGGTVSGTIDVAAAASCWAASVVEAPGYQYKEANVYIQSLDLKLKKSDGTVVSSLPTSATGGNWGQLTIPANVTGELTLEATAVASNGLSATSVVNLTVAVPPIPPRLTRGGSGKMLKGGTGKLRRG